MIEERGVVRERERWEGILQETREDAGTIRCVFM